MTASFTPGPWTAEPYMTENGGKKYSITSACEETGSTWNEANARLIAAAPDLLATLQNAVHALQYCMNHHMPDDEMLRPKCQKNIDSARAVIAAVRGGE